MLKTLINLGFAMVFLLAISCGQTKPLQQTEKGQLEESQEKNRDIDQVSISEKSAHALLKYLASDKLQGRQTGTEGIEEAADQIETIFRKNHVGYYYETYRDSFEIKGKTGYNLVGMVEGTDPELKDEFIVLGAHYDHIGRGEEVEGDSIANGANDNAAGTVAVVEIAKHFAKIKDNKRSLLFILFSAEEMGLEGSKHNAKKLKDEGLDLYAMLNFEMIGVPMENKDYLAYVTGFENSNLARKFNEYSNDKVLGYLPQAKEYNLFQRSDNFPYFEEFNVPAQTICTFDFTNYDYYHHVSDEVEELDVNHMVHVIESVIPGIHKMSNTEEKEIKLTE